MTVQTPPKRGGRGRLLSSASRLEHDGSWRYGTYKQSGERRCQTCYNAGATTMVLITVLLDRLQSATTRIDLC